MKIAGSTALVTGANRGLGRHLAAELLARGATVYAGARNPDSVDLPGVTPVRLDITDPTSVAAAAELAKNVNLLINNAGIDTRTDLLDGDLDLVRLELETHYIGTLSTVRAFAPVIAGNGGGTILNVLSVLSWFGSPIHGAYGAAKSAEWSMTNTVRVQLAERGIRVSGLHVGYLDTDMAADVTGPKLDPATIARIAVDGIEADAYEILADDLSRQVQAGLAGGVAALYPQLP
ncbi:NAD(P)-dependent dehydrogenase (short-subunit alcohol dehydrogenase family) [Micromonospora jinlongensis]|uniref:NAD(P)-dependent dehydrogenase (Short-subunit alcohol dehydrogenase family) n=1 Tax=Micromonospora jinlongensis TaxID=1287877 RepID=A0A7Z0BBC5_9ACTN|nr:SDR family oxidoreductase [Micromonospora jinlongensis]NYH40676.1 NAD(P)-dependent dehydrogenase (short-subunit alcohol dehydrogenase family) [Micromonospora jinlongensis]